MALASDVLEYTTNDIFTGPDVKRAELIDGKMYVMAPPKTKNKKIAHLISWDIESYIRSNNGKFEVYPAPFAVFLNADNKTYVEPDISVISDRNKLTEDGYNGAPDWIIEVVSPSSRHMDYVVKLFKYRTTGVKEYWIVDPSKNRVAVYDFQRDEIGDYSFSDSIASRTLENLEINFSQMLFD